MTPQDDPLLTPSEKKRLRDRRAQRVLREKRERHIRALEERVSFCDAHHGPPSSTSTTTATTTSSSSSTPPTTTTTTTLTPESLSDEAHLLDRIRHLQSENQTLLDRQTQLLQLTSSWTTTTTTTQRVSSPAESAPSPQGVSVSVSVPITTVSQLLADEPYPSPAKRRPSSSAPKPTLRKPSTDSPDHTSILDASASLPALVPAWALTPSEDTLDAAIAPATCPWLTRPDLVALCPDEPSPLDLLHGTRRNFLADTIHRSLRSHHCRDPEVLAMGYLVYYYSKWRVSPSVGRYERLPGFMRPVLGQLQTPHAQCLDQIVWPRLRLNLMRVSRERLIAVTELLGCCLKVRWKWGRDILERDENDTLRVKRSFLETFMEVDGWGITNEFIEEYPELLVGMDVARILYTIT